MIPTRSVLCGLAAAFLVVANTAEAVPWQWRDAQGRMVYSDRPPPADVRASQIVRSPAAPPAASPSSGSATAAPAPTPTPGAPDHAAAPATDRAGASAAATPAVTWVERERAFRARQAEREANEAKAREEEERATLAKRACEDTQRTIRTLESGLRVVSVNTNGESETLDDAERARRLKTARADLERHCAAR
ncbi:MAG TPA: DUF4124 domain-containing protein [Zeimonas sp.]